MAFSSISESSHQPESFHVCLKNTKVDVKYSKGNIQTSRKTFLIFRCFTCFCKTFRPSLDNSSFPNDEHLLFLQLPMRCYLSFIVLKQGIKSHTRTPRGRIMYYEKLDSFYLICCHYIYIYIVNIVLEHSFCTYNYIP